MRKLAKVACGALVVSTLCAGMIINVADDVPNAGSVERMLLGHLMMKQIH